MISVYVYKNFLKEKKYIIDFVFGEIFDCDYKIIPDDEKSYRIGDGINTLRIIDSFFSNLEEDYPYYQDRNLVPEPVIFTDYAEQELKNIPVLFGNAELKMDIGNYCLCNDIFAAIFFMLTRWEEIAISKFDNHGRFTEEENLSVRLGFCDRPVVNEYIQLLKMLMNKAGIIIKEKNRESKVFLTHDIDDIARYDIFFKIVKALAGDIIKRRSISTFLRTVKDSYNIKIKKYRDVYDTFDFLMDLSERNGVKSRFYFIPGYVGEEDVRFDIRNPRVKKILDRIKLRNHVIGIHPSYSSYCNKDQFIKEKKRIEEYSENIYEGRQHYLRVKIPDTWQLWEDCGLRIDSSIGFYNRTGYRAGICFEYPLFNVISRKLLNLRERPLIVMDTALRKQCGTKEKAIEIAIKHIVCCKKYKGDFVLLWHNSNLSVNEWAEWDSVYKQITEQI